MLIALIAVLILINMIQGIALYKLSHKLDKTDDTLQGHSISIGRLNARVTGFEDPVISGRPKLPPSFFSDR